MASTSYELTTFADIYNAVLEELKIQTGDTKSLNRIKRDINILYIDEVIPFSQWKWLRGNITLNVPPYYSTGTAAVTVNETVVTLTVAPGTTKKRYYFSASGYSEVYRIAQHTANSTTLYLESPYTGPSSTTATFKIWSDEVSLPAFVRETFEITHDFRDIPLENCGLQKFRSFTTALPKAEGRPQYYTTDGYYDPAEYASVTSLPAISTRASAGLVKTIVFASSVEAYLFPDDRIEVATSGDKTYDGRATIISVSGSTVTYTGIYPLSEGTVTDATMAIQRLQPSDDNRRQKRILVYPSLNTYSTQLHCDYIREVEPLVEDTDQPIMPIGDRSVLLYGALSRAWSRERNPDEANRNQLLYGSKLSRMAGKVDDSIDQPTLRLDKSYLSAKRMYVRSRGTQTSWGGSGVSSSGGQTITGLASRAAQFGTDGVLAASTVTTTELARLSGILSSCVGISDTQILTNKSIDALTNTITNIANVNVAAAAGIVYSKLSLTNSIVNADVAAAAAIDFSKLAALTSAHILVGNASNVATNVAVTGDISLTNAGVTAYLGTLANTKGGTGGDSSAATGIAHVASGTWSYSTIVNADISASAAIAFSKFATLTSGNILVGSAGNVATSVAMSGDVTIVASGAASLVATTNATLASLTKSTGVAIHGTNTNSSPSAGNIGEFISANPGGNVTPAASGSYANITSISLTAGNWIVEGFGVLDVGTIVGNRVIFAISSTSAASDSSASGGFFNFQGTLSTTFGSYNFPTGSRRFSLSGTTTIYLVGLLNYSALNSADFNATSFLQARRTD